MEDLVLSCLESRVEENRNLYARFLVGPFLRGDALTVATALRRVLLSSVESIGITALYIQGITHEFSTIVGIRESVLELSLNFGAIVLSYDKTFYQKKSFFDLLQIGYLQVQGPKVVYANHLKLPLGVKLVDPTQYIATISKEGFIALKFVIGKKNTFFHPNIGSESQFGNTAKNLSIVGEISKKNIAIAKKRCSYRNGSTVNSFLKIESSKFSGLGGTKKADHKSEDLWCGNSSIFKKKTGRRSNRFFANLVASLDDKVVHSSTQLPRSDLQQALYAVGKNGKHQKMQRSAPAQTGNSLRLCTCATKKRLVKRFALVTNQSGICASNRLRTKLYSVLFCSLPFKVHSVPLSPKIEKSSPSVRVTNRGVWGLQSEALFAPNTKNHSTSGVFLIQTPERRHKNKNGNTSSQKHFTLFCRGHNQCNFFGAAFWFRRFGVHRKKRYKQVIPLSARSKLCFDTFWINSMANPKYSFVRRLQKNTLDRSGLLIFEKSENTQKRKFCYKQQHRCLSLSFTGGMQNLLQGEDKKRNVFKKPFESKIKPSNQYNAAVLPFLRDLLERKKSRKKKRVKQKKITFLSNSNVFKSDICLRNIIPLDFTLTPVLKVNFVVEIDDEVLYLNQKLRERIILEVWTNGSIHPRQAVHDSALRLLDMFATFRYLYQGQSL